MSNVINPSHYKDKAVLIKGKLVQPYELIKHYDFTSGNVIKYLIRASKEKDGSKVNDYKKAIWYLSQILDEMENNFYLGHSFLGQKFASNSIEDISVTPSFGVDYILKDFITAHPLLELIFIKDNSNIAIWEYKSRIGYNTIINAIKELEKLCNI